MKEGMWVVIAVLFVLGIQRLFELRHAESNRAFALHHGGVEHGADHYWMFVALHSLWFVGILLEYAVGWATLPSWWMWGIGVACMLQVGRYWVIGTLGKAWNTRVITWPGMPIASSGPFKWLRHPNYVIVVLELAMVPLTLGCWLTAVVVGVLNLVLLLRVRLPVEAQAIAQAKA